MNHLKKYFLACLIPLLISITPAHSKSCIDQMLDEIDSLADKIPASSDDWPKIILKLPPPDKCGGDTAPVIKYIAEVMGSEFAYEYDKFHAK